MTGSKMHAMVFLKCVCINDSLQVSGRLFSDSGLRRSTRLAGEAVLNTNTNTMQVGANGAGHSSSKYYGGFSSSSKLSSVVFRSVTVRKGQSLANESFEEGDIVPYKLLTLIQKYSIFFQSTKYVKFKMNGTSVLIFILNITVCENLYESILLGSTDIISLHYYVF